MTIHSPPRIIVGTMSPGLRYGCFLSPRDRQSSRRVRMPCITSMAFSIALTAPPSRQPGCTISAWPARPSTVIGRVDGAATGDPGIELGRFAAETGVGPHAVVDAGVGAGAARLFVGVGAEDDVAGQAYAEPMQDGEREELIGDAALHVAGCRGRRGGRRAPRARNGSLVQRSRGSAETASMWPLSEEAATAALTGQADGELRPAAEVEVVAAGAGGPSRSAPAPTGRAHRRCSGGGHSGSSCRRSSSRAGSPGWRAVVSKAISSLAIADELVGPVADGRYDALLEIGLEPGFRFHVSSVRTRGRAGGRAASRGTRRRGRGRFSDDLRAGPAGSHSGGSSP